MNWHPQGGELASIIEPRCLPRKIRISKIISVDCAGHMLSFLLSEIPYYIKDVLFCSSFLRALFTFKINWMWNLSNLEASPVCYS